VRPESVDKFFTTHPIQTLRTGNKQLEYISTGNGKRTILLLPGGGQTAPSNFALIEALELKNRVVAPSVYNFGSINEFCQAMDLLLDHQAVDKVNIYGLSVGGLLAQSYLWRKPERVDSVILSHACTPESRTYERKVVKPLRALSILLPYIPENVIRKVARASAIQLQKAPPEHTQNDPLMNNPGYAEMTRYFAEEFYDSYLTKTLLRSWASLHNDFFRNEKFKPSHLDKWPGRVLILRTDNDPMMQDEGHFANLYPGAKVRTFTGTGHVTFYYQFTEMLKEINDFI
jgi:pimeloyl-ACP methyl ester carboxylesterase